MQFLLARINKVGQYTRSHSGTLFQYGGVLKWTTRADCKSAGYAFKGSNPFPATIFRQPFNMLPTILTVPS